MKTKKILLFFLTLIVSLTAVGCGGKEKQTDLVDGVKPDKPIVVEFWMYGDDTELAVYKQLVEEFNKANEGYVIVKFVQKAGTSYSNALKTVLRGNSGPDIFYVEETGFKAMAENGTLYDLSSYVEKSTAYKVSDMWDSAVSRFQYDVNTKSNNGPDKKYYAVPKDIGPTVVYYNETFFNNAGVKVISVAAEDLDAFNNNGAKDARGKTKSDYGINCEVKEKGYFVDNSGKKWFNNKIAMSWEETRTLAQVVQTSMRKKDSKAFGFYTEWWFNYGWSVGGDCIQYIPTDDQTYVGGYYDFTLMDPTANYIVADDAEPFTINGNTYYPGQTISYNDKLVNEAPTTPGKKDTTKKQIEPSVLEAAKTGQLNELPSQREAFVEFVRLAATKGTKVDGELYGYEVSPYPNSIGGDSQKAEAFAKGQVAMLIDGRWDVTTFREKMDGKYEWDVAPLPIYKQYDTEGNVKVHGVPAGHSGSIGVAINAKTQVPNAAWKFLEYIGGEYGQSVQSKTGFAIPLQKHLAEDDEIFLQSSQNPRNSAIFIEAAENQKAGDWWYLRDNAWITNWANLLNGSVRNGKLTLTDFYNHKDYDSTYNKLLEYTKKK